MKNIAISFIAVAAAIVLLSAAAVADPLPVSYPTFEAVPENPQTSLTVAYTLTNDTAGTLYLDYMLATIVPTGPDPTDMATFAGLSNTLDAFAIPAGAQATWYFNLVTRGGFGCDPCDYGVNPLSFMVEYNAVSPFWQSPATADINAPGTGMIMTPYFTDNPRESQTVLDELQACYNNPSTGLCTSDELFQGGINGSPDPAVTYVYVYDVPEPGSIALVVAGMLAFAAALDVKIGRHDSAKTGRDHG